MIINRESAKLLVPSPFVSYVPRALRALVPYLPRALHALAPYEPRALRAFCLTCLESCVPRAKRALMSHVSHVMLYLTCLVPCVFLGCLLLGILRPPVLLVPHLLQVFQA